MKAVLLSTAAAALLLMGTASAAPKGSGPLSSDPTMKMQLRAQPPMPQVASTLASTVTTYGNSAPTLSQVSGFQDLDAAQKVVCPGPGRCLITAEQHVQFGNTTATQNLFAICSTLNGHYMADPTCPYLGVVPTDGTFIAGNFSQAYQLVKAGTYTVQTQVYTTAAADVDTYQITYHVYSLPQ